MAHAASYAISTAPVGTPLDALTGLVVAQHGIVVIGATVTASGTATSDGRPVADPMVWHDPADCHTPRDMPIYYERHTGFGLHAHGWVCPSCRTLVQSG